MGALFPRWTNGVYWLVLVSLASSVMGGLIGLMLYVRTPINTEVADVVDQPVEFDHRHHVIDDQIDCIYCHRGAEVSDFAGVPATEVCMGCHAQIYNESPLLETVRRSYFSGLPIPWNRVHDLPDFVYFNHAVHVRGGIGCVACHGRVDQMARVYKVAPLTMGWCLDCHARVDEFSELAAQVGTARLERHELADKGFQHAGLGPESALWGIFPDVWRPEPSLGPRELTALTTCTACHR